MNVLKDDGISNIQLVSKSNIDFIGIIRKFWQHLLFISTYMSQSVPLFENFL